MTADGKLDRNEVDHTTADPIVQFDSVAAGGVSNDLHILNRRDPRR